MKSEFEIEEWQERILLKGKEQIHPEESKKEILVIKKLKRFKNV